MKLKHKLSQYNPHNDLTNQELRTLHANLMAYNERVPASQDKHITYYHYNENNIRFIFNKCSTIMVESFNLIDKLNAEIEGYKTLLEDPLYKMIKESKDKIKQLEDENFNLKNENAGTVIEKDNADKIAELNQELEDLNAENQLLLDSILLFKDKKEMEVIERCEAQELREMKTMEE